VLCSFSITFARLNIIALYYRIFSVHRTLVLVFKLIGAMTVMWLITAFCLGVFRCSPVDSPWNPMALAMGEADCLNLNTIFIVLELINGALDLALVCLPVPMLSKLYVPLKNRIGLCVVFLLGSL
jgi:hypothetical protein